MRVKHITATLATGTLFFLQVDARAGRNAPHRLRQLDDDDTQGFPTVEPRGTRRVNQKICKPVPAVTETVYTTVTSTEVFYTTEITTKTVTEDVWITVSVEPSETHGEKPEETAPPLPSSSASADWSSDVLDEGPGSWPSVTVPEPPQAPLPTTTMLSSTSSTSQIPVSSVTSSKSSSDPPLPPTSSNPPKQEPSTSAAVVVPAPPAPPAPTTSVAAPAPPPPPPPPPAAPPAATTKPTAQAPPPAAPPAVGVQPAGKKGLNYNNAALLSQFKGVGWVANWEQTMEGVPAGMHYYPMLWNTEKQRTDRWTATCEAAMARGDKVLLGFNEPQADMCANQACMTADVAAAAWRQYMTPWKSRGAILVSPSITQGDIGANWLTDFLNMCPPADCKVDAISLHWYEGAHQIEYFKKYFTDAHNNPAFHGLPIYVTEFAPTTGTMQEKANFVREAVAWMNKQDYILGYALHWAEDATTGGVINEMGTAYLQAS
ncbi:glycoside hydrolase family 128 protein [Cystobasidium minutum MCA 4210]|uniref:glycoside hydrolase family 128 protein n=1 Tax=Cystobasidium minutum MCA 4210 TaxID=1397322 RepID=UPI0034CFA1CD|eukprot:jgi/Rhomi1/212923/estExt_Genemark1.C_80141